MTNERRATDPEDADFTPKRRPLLTRRFAIILFVLACVFNTAVFWQGTHTVGEDELAREIAQVTLQNEIAACNRANNVRRELNQRADFHIKDAENLAKLSAALAQNRKDEAKAVAQIQRESSTRPLLQPFIAVLERASKVDRDIQKVQSNLVFNKLRIVPCETEILKP